MHKNNDGHTLLTLIEMNKHSLPETLITVLKCENAFHENNINATECCLRDQLESSLSTNEIIALLHQQEKNDLSTKICNWIILILITIITSILFTFWDMYSDYSLLVEYHSDMNNLTKVDELKEKCDSLINGMNNLQKTQSICSIELFLNFTLLQIIVIIHLKPLKLVSVLKVNSIIPSFLLYWYQFFGCLNFFVLEPDQIMIQVKD